MQAGSIDRIVHRDTTFVHERRHRSVKRQVYLRLQEVSRRSGGMTPFKDIPRNTTQIGRESRPPMTWMIRQPRELSPTHTHLLNFIRGHKVHWATIWKVLSEARNLAAECGMLPGGLFCVKSPRLSAVSYAHGLLLRTRDRWAGTAGRHNQKSECSRIVH